MHTVVDLGVTPLANSYVAPGAPPDADPSFELHARLCTGCGLVQVRDVVPAESIFSDYAYFSSYSSSWLAHARRFADASIARFGLTRDDLVVEVASNDGYLLKNYLEAGIAVLGIEPAENVAAVAEEAGIPTRVEFFGQESASALHDAGKRPKLVIGNNVFAHVPDINDFAAGLATLAGDHGVVVLEFPHLEKLVEHTQFDTIYHEHYSYLSLAATRRILGAAGLDVFDVEELPTHGGSLRVFAAAPGMHETTRAVGEILAREDAGGLADPETYRRFGERVHAIRRSLLDFLGRARSEGSTVAAYGAAAKGNTLLNFAGVTAEDVLFVADRNPHKQGLLMPGSRIPIVAPEDLVAAQPDYVLILPWNLRDEITEELAEARSWGGQFVTAVPELAITS
jgi:hypothetical protein